MAVENVAAAPIVEGPVAYGCYLQSFELYETRSVSSLFPLSLSLCLDVMCLCYYCLLILLSSFLQDLWFIDFFFARCVNVLSYVMYRFLLLNSNLLIFYISSCLFVMIARIKGKGDSLNIISVIDLML